jgi:type II secretory pathway pseudopilin PulG
MFTGQALIDAAKKKKKRRNQLLAIVFSVSILIISLFSALAYLTYQKNKAEKLAKEAVLGASTSKQESVTSTQTPTQVPTVTPTSEPTSTPTIPPTPIPTNTPVPTATPTIAPANGKQKYSYDYLDISFEYPGDWKVSVSKTNNQGSGFRFDCKDKTTADMFVKDLSKCLNDEIEPENLTITGPHNEKIILWQINRLEVSCPPTKDFKFIILGKLKTFTPMTQDGNIMPCYGPIIEPGAKSNWKSFRVNFITPPEYYNDLEAVLQSMTYNP